MNLKTIKNELQEYWKALPVNNTHCHHLTGDMLTNISLHKLVSMTYNSWICPPFEDSEEGWAFYFDRMGVNSYSYWLAQAYGELYGNSRLDIDNYKEIDRKVRETYARNTAWHEEILTGSCGYAHVVLDDYQSPGNTHGLPIVRPTFRTDMFLCGNCRNGRDSNSNSAYAHFEKEPLTLDEYVEQMERAVETKIRENGSRSLKLAIAYERGLDFTEFDRDAAARAFMNEKAGTDLKKAFADYIADCLCKIAAKFGIPFQIHTGLGQLEKTNAMQLLPLIRRNPETKFVLFHCSFPWSDDVLALGHDFGNVYPDLCWLPLLSTAAAEDFLARALDTLDAHRLTWGCDTWTSEESYGALLAIREVLTNVLAKRVEKGFYTLDYAQKVGRYILHDNAQRLYNF